MWKSSTGVATVAVAAAAAASVASVAAVAISKRMMATSSSPGAAVSLAASRLESITRRRPANVGDPLTAVETPCLVVDLDAMEKNLRLLPESLKEFPHVAVRPHAKAHKCAAIAQRQLQLSKAVGLCCQKVAEAEAMFAGGIQNLLLSNEIFGFSRYERMARLAQQGATITLIFDHVETIAQAQAVAIANKIHFHALVDVNVGQERCGVDSVEDALVLARAIDSASHLKLAGIQAYHGGAQHIRDFDTKKSVIHGRVCETARAVRDAFLEAGLACDVVTGGGTGTYLLEASSGVFTEVQPGSYLFNDADYSKNLDASGQRVRDWTQSLFVLATVMSVNATRHEPRAVVDAGMKAVALDSGVPLVHSYVGCGDKKHRSLVYVAGGDEHGILVPPAEEEEEGTVPSLGEMLLLTPGHCDPTANLYDFVVGFRGGVVENVWQVEARGPGN